MKKKFKFGVIGAGFMSTAIIQGVISSNVLKPTDIIVSDVSDVALDKIKKLGVTVTKDNSVLCDKAEYVLFAVKPQAFSTVADEIKNCKCSKYISIMAGVKKDRIKSLIGENKFVARCMPNTPCSVKSGAVGIDFSDYTDDIDKFFIVILFSALASVVAVDESLLGVVTGVSGSSPAYFIFS